MLFLHNFSVAKREYPRFLKRFTSYVVEQTRNKPILFWFQFINLFFDEFCFFHFVWILSLFLDINISFVIDVVISLFFSPSLTCLYTYDVMIWMFHFILFFLYMNNQYWIWDRKKWLMTWLVSFATQERFNIYIYI